MTRAVRAPLVPIADDPHSFSNPWAVRTTRLDLDLAIDFTTKRIAGSVRHELVRPDPDAELILDTRDLAIESVSLESASGSTPARFELFDPPGASASDRSILGRALRVELADDTTAVTIVYATSPDAEALQWLSPEQTADRAAPFLFTQSQAILARTWVPCQDTPAVRFPWTARVRAPEGLEVVMSAERLERDESGAFRFRMPQPVPSYLLALAAGKLEFREISARSGVWAEPSVVERAQWEFADTEKMIAAAEDLYGPYRWERYDILVLPPSFPWGGMENPRLTFATPTILAGDRSLVALIAHELAHSWSGNLVTNATWSDFWLNEGFTVYFEHRIMEKLYGKDLDEMLAWIGYDELLADLERLPPADTSLVLPLAGRDPNDGMTAIAYEKGYFFLRTCEQVIGRARWDRFLRRYFDRFAFQSMTSEGFLSYLRGEILTNDPDLERRLDPESWIYKPGLPENVSRPEPRRLAVLDRALERFSKGASPDDLDASEWTTFDWLYFLRRLPRPADSERLAALDRAFSLTTTGNAEVACEWLILAIRSNYEPAIPRLEEFLREVGRLKFIRPLYTALEEISPSGSAIARRIYSRARSGYHPIAIKVLDSLFER